MRYFGGKQRISKPLTEFLNNILEPDQPFIDAFCGSCNVVSKVDSKRYRVANDYHYELIAMWRAFQNGWIPPVDISEDDYKHIKVSGSPEMKSFVGFGCSYSGKYWGGYARGGGKRNYAQNALNSSLRKMKTMQDVDFQNVSYEDLKIPIGALVYCDIPYYGTTGYSVGSFNHIDFYHWAKRTQGVVVSEYLKNVPEEAYVIWTHESRKDIRNKKGEQESTAEVVFTFDEDVINKVLNMRSYE